MSVQAAKEDSIGVVGQEKFYSDKLGSLLLMLLLLTGLTVAILGVTLYIHRLKNPAPVFFKSSERGELIPEIPLDQPNMAPNALLNWVTENMMQNFTFNFVNYAKVIESAREDFTTEGYQTYTESLQTSRVLEKVIANKYVLRAQATSSPQITKEGVLANRYLWKIKLTMSFRYKSVTSTVFEDADIILLVMRVPNQQSPYGIKILKYDVVIKRPT